MSGNLHGWVLKVPCRSIQANRHTGGINANWVRPPRPCTFPKVPVDKTRVSQIQCTPLFLNLSDCLSACASAPLRPLWFWPLSIPQSSSTRIMSSALPVIDIRNSYGTWMFPSSPGYPTDSYRTGATLLGALMSCMCVNSFGFEVEQIHSVSQALRVDFSTSSCLLAVINSVDGSTNQFQRHISTMRLIQRIDKN